MKYVFFFFYGSLQQGGFNHKDLPKEAVFITNAELPYKMYETEYKYPAITEESGICKGEIYAIKKDDIKSLDSIENYQKRKSNSEYIRRSVTYGNWHIYAYFASKELEERLKKENRIIKDGDWLNYYKKYVAKAIIYK